MKAIIRYLNTTHGAVVIAIIAIVISAIIIITRALKISFTGLLVKVMHNTTKGIGKVIYKKEVRYHRDIEIGKINRKNKRYRLYRFLNDLTIDLGLKRQGVTPYEFLFLMLVLSFIIAAVVGWGLFSKTIIVILSYPIIAFGVICTFYTKANLAHDLRIEAVIEAENIISNNINDGVVVAVRNSYDSLPKDVKMEFKDFLDNMEHENYYIKTALLDLNNKLGSVADDFISKCIMFELEEEHGIAGIFKDVVELNNIKTQARTDMKHKFERVTTQFIIGVSMILIFLFGVIAVFPVVRNFYFKYTAGQLLLVGDAAIIIGEFVYITYLRAKEL